MIHWLDKSRETLEEKCEQSVDTGDEKYKIRGLPVKKVMNSSKRATKNNKDKTRGKVEKSVKYVETGDEIQQRQNPRKS